MTPDVITIVEQHLTANGYDGLFNSDADCACVTSDLAPCGQIGHDCRAGYKHDRTDGWCISGSKEPPTEEDEV